MDFRTLEDVTRFNAHQRQALIGMVSEASPELLSWRPAPDKWSLLEHLEHVGLYREFYLPVLEELASKAKPATPETERHVDALPAVAAAGIAPDQKIQAPEPMVPRGRSLAESLASVEQSQARFAALVAQFPQLDTDRALYQHRVGVPLNLAQLWHFIGLHDYRHIQQMRAILEAWQARPQA